MAQTEKQAEKLSLIDRFIPHPPSEIVSSFDTHKTSEIADTVAKNLEKLWRKISSFLNKKVASHLGPWAGAKVFLGITWFILLLCVLLLFLLVLSERALRVMIRAVLRRAEPKDEEIIKWVALVFKALTNPLSLFVWVIGMYWVLFPIIMHFPKENGSNQVNEAAIKIVYLGVVIALVWFAYRLIALVDAQLNRLAEASGKTFYRMMAALAKYLRAPLRLLFILVLIRAIITILTGSSTLSSILADSFSLSFIICIAWMIIATTNLMEDFVDNRYNIDIRKDPQARKILTQTRYFKKVIIIAVIVLAFGSMLMVFPNVGRFGMSILASAGVIGIIAGLAVQRTLSNIFVGMQIAITQPIRVEDVVVVENEWGWIEEITATYVVVRIWDLRRLILPISYFAEKPFQNWTRISTDLLGTVFLYVDYTVPVDTLREKLLEILKNSENWDGKSWALEVTDATETSMQIRALMSAENSSSMWNLRCEVREKLIEYVQQKHQGSLPRLRTDIKADGEWEDCPLSKEKAAARNKA